MYTVPRAETCVYGRKLNSQPHQAKHANTKLIAQDPRGNDMSSPSPQKQLKLHFHQVSKQELDKRVAFVFTYMPIRCIEDMLFGIIVWTVVSLSSALFVAFFNK